MSWLSRFHAAAAAQPIAWRYVAKMGGAGIAVVIMVYAILYLVADQKLDSVDAERRANVKVTVDALASLASDYDNDGTLEPPVPTNANGEFAATAQDVIAPSLNIPNKNSTDRLYRYCAWDFGTIINPARYQTALSTTQQPIPLAYPAPSKIVLAVVDAGRNNQFETACQKIVVPDQAFGDDISVTMDIGAMTAAHDKPKTVKQQAVVTCAFGEIYTWDEARQNWFCAKPAAELLQTMPAGCPSGQVLVERNKKIKCENSENIFGKTADEGKFARGAQADPASSQPTTNTATDNPLPNSGAPGADPDTTALPPPAPRATPNATLPPPGGSTNPAVPDAATPTATPVNNPASNAPAQNNAVTVLPPLRSADTPPPLTGVNLLPGENIAAETPPASVPNYIGTNLLGGDTAENSTSPSPTATDPGISRSVKKFTRSAKFHECSPWLYLRRTTGVVTQCVRRLPMADRFGDTAGMTSWPTAQNFLASAFLFCPVLRDGQIGNCVAQRFTPSLSAADPAALWRQDGYMCARTANPLPPPWPQFDSVIFQENAGIPGTGSCRADFVPTVDATSGQVLCYPLNGQLQKLRTAGACGCGWTQIWNPVSGTFQCS